MQFTRYKTHDAASSPHLGVWNRKAELCQMGAPKQGSPVQVYVCVHARRVHTSTTILCQHHSRACTMPALCLVFSRCIHVRGIPTRLAVCALYNRDGLMLLPASSCFFLLASFLSSCFLFPVCGLWCSLSSTYTYAATVLRGTVLRGTVHCAWCTVHGAWCSYNYPIFYPGDYSKEELEHCIAGMVIDFDAACCNLDRIRNGITMVALLSGLGWVSMLYVF